MENARRIAIEFDFDADKSRTNVRRHGVTLEEATKLWLDTHVIVPAKNVLGELRYAIIGRIRKKLYVAIFTERGDKVRLISCHRADKRWEKIYHENQKEKNEADHS